MQLKVVITGGPGSGKSTLINHLTDLGYNCMPEISRELILSAKKNGIDQLFLENPNLFSETLLKMRVDQFLEADTNKSNLVFFDRGIPDIHAYLDYLNKDYPKNYINESLKHQYNTVFITPPWQDIYKIDNERYENFEQATSIYNVLKKTYIKLGYNVLKVPIGTVEKRVRFILNKVGE